MEIISLKTPGHQGLGKKMGPNFWLKKINISYSKHNLMVFLAIFVNGNSLGILSKRFWAPRTFLKNRLEYLVSGRKFGSCSKFWVGGKILGQEWNFVSRWRTSHRGWNFESGVKFCVEVTNFTSGKKFWVGGIILGQGWNFVSRCEVLGHG